jgi:hypothetical protein
MQAAAIILADAAGTPVDHTFAPNGKDEKGVLWYVDRSQENAIGYWRISVEFKEPAPASAGVSSKERAFRIRLGMHEPVLETLSNSTVSGITPAPTVAYVPRAFKEYIFSERSTKLERQHLRKMSTNLEDNVTVVALIEDLDRLY